MTDERLGVYRPEEHIDNPKDYADNKDARQYDPRLRGLIQPIELEIDPQTGMVSLFSTCPGTEPAEILRAFARANQMASALLMGTRTK